MLGNSFAGALVLTRELSASSGAAASALQVSDNLPLTATLIAPPAGAPGQAAPSWLTFNKSNPVAGDNYYLQVQPPSFPASASGLLCWVQVGAGDYAEFERVIFNWRLDDTHGGAGGIPGGVVAAAVENSNVSQLAGYFTDAASGAKRGVFIRGSSTRYAVAGQAFSFLFVCFEGTAPAFPLAANNELPAWANLSQSTVQTEDWVLSGTAPATPGVYAFNLHASDGTGVDDTRVFIKVIAPPVPVVSGSSSSAAVGSALTFAIAATNHPASYAASGLPDGMHVNTATGAITGTPTTAGTYAVTVAATNAGGTGSAAWNVSVRAPAFPVLGNVDATATVGAPFAYQVVASGSPAGYGVVGLPAGMTFNAATGAVAGVPTTAGTSNVTFSATNAGGTGTQSVVFTVAPAPTTGGGSSGGTGGSGGTGSATGGTTGEAYPFAFVQIDLPTGKITAQAGALGANHGDAIIFQVQFGPADFVGAVTTTTFTIKEKSEATQFLNVLSGGGAVSTDGSNFLFPALGVSGPDLDASLRLLDEIAPSMVVTYSLQFRWLWNGRSRSSEIVDFPIKRDLSFLPAVGVGTTSGPYTPGAGTTSSPTTIVVVSAPLAASPTTNVGQNVNYGCVVDGAMGIFQLKYGTFPAAAAVANPDLYVQPTDYSPTNQRYWLKVL